MGKNLELLLKDVPSVSIQGSGAKEVLSLSSDSRNCQKGSLFTAIGGENLDGHNFIDEAIAAGARFIVHERDFAPPKGIIAIKVPDSRKALANIARNFFEDPSAKMTLLGVSGTNGKTTTTYLLESLLKMAGNKVGRLGTINYHYGENTLPAPNTTPDALTIQVLLKDMLAIGTSHVVMEVSSHAAALRRIDACHFAFGVFTNLSPEHLDFHKDMESYYCTKRRFFLELVEGRYNPRVAINIDDDYGIRLAKEMRDGYISYGIVNPQAEIRAQRCEFSLNGIKADIIHPNGNFPITSELIGRHNLFNILAATSTALALGIPVETIQKGIAALTNVPGRLERVGKGKPAIFIDYAHTPDALEKVIDHLSLFKKGRLLTVFGCGGNRDRSKRPRMGAIATTASDVTIITSDNPRREKAEAIIAEILEGIDASLPRALDPTELTYNRGYSTITNRREAIAAVLAIAQPEDIVLIAGKGSETYQEIAGERFFFDDRLVAREEWEKKSRLDK